jgi:signal transduction histidine kinase
MSPEVVKRAFEPFFTTKGRDDGTGLGLAMVRGYAEQLRGAAEIESRQGVGTTVRVYLPLDAEDRAEAAA